MTPHAPNPSSTTSPPSAKSPERLAYGMQAAAEAIDVTRQHLYRLANAGKLKTVMVGGRRLVPAEELHRILEEGAV